MQFTVAPEQLPLWQASAVVQALPSLQVVPSVLLGFEQLPFAGSHVPAVWHWSCAVQVTGLLPLQTPVWQVSVFVQALPSSQVAPFALLGFEHWPVP
jgi:hypothetical protein